MGFLTLRPRQFNSVHCASKATDTYLFSLGPFLSFWSLQRQRKWVIVDRTRIPSGISLPGPDFQYRQGVCVAANLGE